MDLEKVLTEKKKLKPRMLKKVFPNGGLRLLNGIHSDSCVPRVLFGYIAFYLFEQFFHKINTCM